MVAERPLERMAGEVALKSGTGLGFGGGALGSGEGASCWRTRGEGMISTSGVGSPTKIRALTHTLPVISPPPFPNSSGVPPVRSTQRPQGELSREDTGTVARPTGVLVWGS
jgi:hypothetical protein